MPAYRGRDLTVLIDATDISGDGRSLSFEESADALDGTTVGDDARVKIPGLRDASGSFEAIDTTGTWGTAWQGMEPGQAAALLAYPEGDGIGEREISANIVITGRTLNVPYDDIATVSMSFEVSGDVTEGVKT